MSHRTRTANVAGVFPPLLPHPLPHAACGSQNAAQIDPFADLYDLADELLADELREESLEEYVRGEIESGRACEQDNEVNI